jgi:hypothetical protein
MPEGPRIRIAANIHLTPEIEAVLRSMFDDCGQVAVEAEYGRGFSGSRAFKVRLVDTDGRARLPAVIKVALDGLIRSEWQAYEKWVKNTLPNIARLEALPTFPAGNSWGGLRYALVGGGTFEVQSLYAYYQKADIDDICWILEQRLFRIMSRRWWFDNRADHAFQMQSDYDPILPVNLIVRCTPVPNGGETHNIEANSQPPMCPVAIGDCVRLKGFVVAEVDPVRAQLTLNVPPMPDGATSISYRVRLIEVPDLAVYQAGDVLDEIGGDVVTTRHDLLVGRASRSLWQTVDFSNERLALSGQKSLPNPLLTYRALLQDILTVNISTIHGDLNLENILIDPATREVSLIDFATVREGHALHDLLRLETGVLITLVPQALQEAGLFNDNYNYPCMTIRTAH